jgi:transcriptional regulator with XRE-family HTH domain
LDQLKNLGPKIRFYREQRGYTQEQLAEKLGITKGYISRVENNKERPNLEFLVKIADALGVHVKNLFDDDYVIPAPPELKEIGTEWIILNKELKEEGFTVDQIREFVKVVKMIKGQSEK